MKKNSSIIAIALMFGNFLVKILGLLREVFLANFYGTSAVTDSYLIANNIPSVLFAAMGASIASTFIPMYTKISKDLDEKRANSFALHVIEILSFICIIIIILGELFTDKIVYLFAAGFEGEVLSYTLIFSRILFPTLLGIALLNVLGAYLQQHSCFLPFATVPIIGNTAIIISLFFSNIYSNIYILVIGTLIGNSLQVLFYIPWIIKLEILKHDKTSIWNDKYLYKIFLLVIPVFLGEAVNEINSIVDRNLVSGLDVGSVSSLNYAFKIINLVTGVFVASIGSVIYPKLSAYASDVTNNRFKECGRNLILSIVIILSPIMVSIIIYRIEIVQVLFQRGSFNLKSTMMTASVLACYSIGLIFIGIRDVLLKLFFSIQNTKIPMKNGIICAISNILLDVMLIKTIGICGAALATSIVAALGSMLLFFKAYKLDLILISDLMRSVYKTSLSLLVLICFDIFLKQVIDCYLKTNETMHLLLTALCGITGLIIYILLQIKSKNIEYIKKI